MIKIKQIINELGITKFRHRYFIIVNDEGTSDELGNMHGIVASSENEFKKEFKNTMGDDDDIDGYENSYFTFYEVKNKKEMDRVLKISNQWDGEDEITDYLKDIALKAIPYNDIKW